MGVVGRVVAVVATCVVVLVQGAGAQASSARRPVTMTLTRPAGQLTLGDEVTLTGRASAAAHGNAGNVDLYYRAAAETVFTLIGTARADSAGSFTFPWYLQASGTVRAAYRGNAARQPASRQVDFVAYTAGLRARVAFDLGVGRPLCQGSAVPACAAHHVCTDAAPNPCEYRSPVAPITDSAIKVAWALSCDQPGSSLVLGYADSTTATGPPAAGETPGTRDWYVKPADTDTSGVITLTPDTPRGRLYVRTSQYCSWTVTALESYEAWIRT